MAKSCPDCGRTNRSTARFCAYCATEMIKYCHICNVKNPLSAHFCHHCATPLVSHSIYTTGTGLLIANTILARRYQVIQRVGQGGMGAVYKATDTRLGNKVVAVKEMSETDLTTALEKQQARHAFQQEAQTLADLNHVNLPRVTDHFSENGKQYLVMDFVKGETLQEILERVGGPLEVEQVIEWGKKLCEVLEYLHGQQPPIIFRDLKPANIMVDEYGQIKLIDFGIVRLFKKGQSTDTTSFGTTGYSPPEQHGPGQTDFRSDIYALGATLHHLLTFRNPIQEPFHFPSIRQFNRNVSKGLDYAITQALAPDPTMRWQTVRQMRDALIGATLIQPTGKNQAQKPTRRYPDQARPNIKLHHSFDSQTNSHAATRKWAGKKNQTDASPPPSQARHHTEPQRAVIKPKPFEPAPPPTRRGKIKPYPNQPKPFEPTPPPTRRGKRKSYPNQPKPFEPVPPPSHRGNTKPNLNQPKTLPPQTGHNNTTKPSSRSQSFLSKGKDLSSKVKALFSPANLQSASVDISQIEPRAYVTNVVVTALIFSIAKVIFFHFLNVPIPFGAALWWVAGPLAYVLLRQPGAAFLSHTLDYLSYVWLIGALASSQLIWLVPGAIIDLLFGRDGYQSVTYQKVVGACLAASIVSLILLLLNGWSGNLYGLLLQLGGAFLGSSIAYLIGKAIRK